MGTRTVMILRCIGSLWVLPIALPIWACYVLPLWALGWIESAWVVDGRAIVFGVTSRGPAWWLRLWEGWAGHTVPFAVIARVHNAPVIRHEMRHADQWLMLGPLFPVVYLALLLWYGYAKHPLELDAKRHEAR